MANPIDMGRDHIDAYYDRCSPDKVDRCVEDSCVPATTIFFRGLLGTYAPGLPNAAKDPIAAVAANVTAGMTKGAINNAVSITKAFHRGVLEELDNMHGFAHGHE